ncbi:MAG: VanZ family protein [Lactococcus lactis]|jgi:glycopeptide antibiotics resistance protein|nr:VanZ family protein [Lactococcus lactis]
MLSYLDYLLIRPLFFVGLIPLVLILLIVFVRKRDIPKVKIIVLSVIFYLYVYIMLFDIVGTPSLAQINRMMIHHEGLFHPQLEFIPFADGLSLSTILNVILFLPFGFLLPLMSKAYQKASNTIFLGLGFSSFIELSQLFTPYRASDINDLITNVLGTVIGYLIFRLIKNGIGIQRQANQFDGLSWLPEAILLLSFIMVFIS